MQRTPLTCLVLSFSLQVLGGCAPSASPGTAPRRDSRVITREQLSDDRFATVYDAVRALRSQWLIERTPDDRSSSAPAMQVYLDGAHLSGVSALNDIAASAAASVRYFDGVEAVARWGRGHERGVILVSTRAAERPDA